MEAAGIKNKHQLAQALDVHDSQIKRWLDEERAPTSTNLLRLARLLGVTPDYLLGEDAPALDALDSALREVRPEERDAVALVVRGAITGIRASQVPVRRTGETIHADPPAPGPPKR